MPVIAVMKEKALVLGLDPLGLKQVITDRIKTYLESLPINDLKKLRPAGSKCPPKKTDLIELLMSTDEPLSSGRGVSSPSSASASSVAVTPNTSPSIGSSSMTSSSPATSSSSSSSTTSKLTGVKLLRAKLESMGLITKGDKETLEKRLMDHLDHLNKSQLTALLPAGVKPGKTTAEVRRQVDALEMTFEPSSPDDELATSMSSLRMTSGSGAPSKAKTSIPKKRLIETWNKWIGKEVGHCKCPLCQDREIQQMDGMTWNGSHVIATANGGSIDVENLRVVCSSCNSSMRTVDMREYCLIYRGSMERLMLE